MVNGHAPVSHKVKHQDELRGITAKLIKIEKLEVRQVSNFRRRLVPFRFGFPLFFFSYI